MSTASKYIKLVSNPPSPWRGEVEWIGEPPAVEAQVFEDASKSILSRNDSPDLSFDWSVNPYRGCYHACAYCYARPSHEFLDFGSGTDFERKLVVKPRAPELLKAAFKRKSWKGDTIVFSGNTDCYQPLEAAWLLTRRCLEVCLEFRNPVSIITKSVLIERDLDLLERLAIHARLRVALSIPFWNRDHAKAIEPHVPSPQRRMKAVRRLSERDIRVGVNIAPIVPGLTDPDIPAILEAAVKAGAQSAGLQMLRLPGPVAEIFETRLRATLPRQADRIMSQIDACRGGSRQEGRFGVRMSGKGPRWDAIATLFYKTRRRLGLDSLQSENSPTTFRRPESRRQLSLFS